MVALSLLATAPAFAAGTPTTAPYTPQATDGGTANGDYVSSSDGGATPGMNTFYRYFVEAPPLARLVVDLWDADVGIGANEAAAGRDRARGDGFDSAAAYRLINPAGRSRLTRYSLGDIDEPVGADNAWLSLFDSTGDAVRDEFTTAAYTNNNGTVAWANNWAETNDDNNAATGLMFITPGELRLGDNNDANASVIQREANLTLEGFTTATLTFTFRTTGVEAADAFRVEVSGNGGGSWTTLDTFTNLNGTTGPFSESYNITPFIATNTRIRFIRFAGYTQANDLIFFDDVQIQETGIDAGHWELQVDMSDAITSGDDINALGIRAHDGNSAAGGTEVPVYYDSHNQFGVNPPGSLPNVSRAYETYPYITAGCTCTKNDHDFDSDSGNTGSLAFHSRTAAFNQTFASGALSGNDAWDPGTITGWTSDQRSVEYGIWNADLTITTYDSGDSGNYSNLYMGRFNLGATPPIPTVNPTPSTFRVYLPIDGGGAPVQPYLEQLLTHVSGPNPPVAGQTSRLSVTVRLVNPTARAINFSTPNNIVTANVPGGGVVYAGNAQGTIVSQPAIGGTGNITWNPGTVAAGATVIMAYQVNVTPPNASRVPVTGTPAMNGTRAQYVDGTGNTTQARSTYLFGPICELAVTPGTLTQAVVADLRATAGPEGVVVAWQTVSEAGTAGFDLYRLEGGRRVRVNRGLIAAVPAAPQGGSYRVLDADAPSGGPLVYEVVETEAAGRQVSYGPFRVVAGRDGSPTETGAAGALRIPRTSPEPQSAAAAQPEPAAAPLAGAATALKIGVAAPGIHFVAAADIAARLGRQQREIAKQIDQGAIALTRRGQPVAWAPVDAGNGLLFYGEGIDSLYSRDDVYWLEVGPGLTMEAAPGGRGIPAATSASFPDTVHAEVDRLAATVVSFDPEADYWFWDYVQAGDPANAKRTFELAAPGLAPGAGPVRLRVGLRGATTSGAAGEHHAVVRVAGAEVGEAHWEGLAAQVLELDVDPGLLAESGNEVEVEALLDAGVPHSLFYVDAFDLTYPRRYRASGDALAFRSGAEPGVTVDGFTDPRIGVFDLSDPQRPRRAKGLRIESDGASGYRVSFVPAASGIPYVAVAPGGWRSPSWLRADVPSDLQAPGRGADYLILTAGELAPAAQELADLRESQGLRTAVVDVEDVMDEFAHGLSTPHAVRDFLDYAYHQWSPAPRAVVLAGDGTFDYKDNLGQGGNLVPPLLVGTPSGLFPADSRFADLDGDDGVPEVAVGRLPVRTAGELAAYVDKVAAFEAADGAGWAGRALVVADDPEGGIDFPADGERLAITLPAGYEPERIYLAPGTAEATRERLFGALADGAALMSYIGHGGLDRLAAEGLLRAEDVPGLANGPRLPVMTALTCSVNRFDVPGFAALGELLTNRPGGGATAVWAPTGLSFHAEGKDLGERFLRALPAEGGRLGDAILRTLASYAGVGGAREMLDLYTLLGDPGLLLKAPGAPVVTPPVGGGSGE